MRLKWQNLLEAICAFPSLVFEAIQKSAIYIWQREEVLVREGEFDLEDMEEYHE